VSASTDWRPSGHLPALDGLRALAVFVVVEHNISLVTGGQGAILHQLESMLHRGWMGVQLFFVLSGFLITRILLETRDSPHYFSSFYSRRALRIFPLYYATLIFLFLLLPALGQTPALLAEDMPLSRQIWLWTYLSNWTGPRGFGGGSAPVFHFWSLAVEEQFYLLFPAILMATYRSQRLKPVAVVVAIGVASLALSQWLLWNEHTGTAYYLLPSRAWELERGSP